MLIREAKMAPALLDELMGFAGEEPASAHAEIVGSDPVFPLRLRVGEAGAAAIAAAAIAAARLWELRTGRMQKVRVEVDAAAAAMRGDRYMRRPRVDPTAPRAPRSSLSGVGDICLSRDGRWIYLHRAFPHHRERIASVLDSADDGESLERAVSRWEALALEDAIHAAGACAGVVRGYEEWSQHAQAKALEDLPPFEIDKIGESPPEPLPAGQRPLAGIRVLDLTRVLAGPTCARTLAEHGADVLRIGTDRLPNNDTQTIDTGHGKRSSVLDLTTDAGRGRLLALAKGADVFSQGYRPGSFAARGLGVDDLAALRPGIIYVSLSAFGHVGPWQHRRGFDTLVQAVSGICNEYALEGRPRHLPVSAIDYVTGYLGAFAVMVALARRAREGGSYHVRLSLAQIGRWLTGTERVDANLALRASPDLPEERIAALTTTTETPFGPVRHLAPIVRMSETPARWERPAVPLDHDPPEWLPRPQEGL
jgi:hypothetical protein